MRMLKPQSKKYGYDPTIAQQNFFQLSHLNNASKRLGLRKFIARIPVHYPPKMAQQNYFLLVQRCFKIISPSLAYYWHANPPFPNGFHNLPAMTQPSVLLGNSNKHL